ncbi:MAG: DUF4870 domain-containing protein [Verrucomicrobiota bacterium]
MDSSPPSPSPLPPPEALRPEDERLYATLIHLSSLLWFFSLPGVLGALILWLLKRERSEFVDRHGKQAMNFQLTIFLVMAAVSLFAVLSVVLSFLGGFLFFLPLWGGVIALFVVQLVLGIQAAIVASRGEYYQYALCFQFFR